ncbi:transposase [Actinoallomurus sp. NPDC052274]|uniref:transposase n=1 Tax=Actinoallomurus sp. NPDC052274 TaxID=3155420 RepID=UPI00343C1DED
MITRRGRSYPPEFRRKVLDLIKAGRSVKQVAADLQISDQTFYSWRKRTGSIPASNPT